MESRPPRAVLSRRLLALLVVLLVPLFVGVPTHLRQDALIGPLGDRYHVGLFLVLTVLLYRHGPLRGRPWLVIALCLALGGATELLQTLAGRSAALWDWYEDALGVGFGASWIWWRRSGRMAGPVAAAVVLVGLVAWPLRHLPIVVPESRAAEARFPLLDGFERPNALVLWEGHEDGAIELVDTEDHGQVLQMTSDGDSRWPGVASRALPWNWSGRHTLTVECRLREPSPATMRLYVWMEDHASRYDSDYALLGFDVDHQWRTLEFPLTTTLTSRSDRHLALEEIRALAIFLVRKDAGPVTLQIDDLRLDGS